MILGLEDVGKEISYIILLLLIAFGLIGDVRLFIQQLILLEAC